MLSRSAAFVIWAAVAASLVFWCLRLLAEPQPVPAHATLVATANAFRGDLSRLFGADDAPTASAQPGQPAPTDARFQLVGVVAPRASAARAEGLAVIAFDGKPARAFRVGSAVDGELVLQSVHARGAALGPRGQPPQLALALPELPPPATGTLPSAGGESPAAPVAPPDAAEAAAQAAERYSAQSGAQAAPDAPGAEPQVAPAPGPRRNRPGTR